MPPYELAVICRNRFDADEFLIVRQRRPTKFGHDEYDSYVDSDLWDLPSVELQPLEGGTRSEIQLEGSEFCPDKLKLQNLDLDLAISKVSEEVGYHRCEEEHWSFWKHVEEPDFGPGLPIQTVYINGRIEFRDGAYRGSERQWISIQRCDDWLLEVNQGSSRLGPLAVAGLLSGLSPQSPSLHIPRKLPFQEYPPGVTIVPMRSRTGKPWRTTNAVIFAPHNTLHEDNDNNFVARGDALLVDPGCLGQFHKELAEIVTSLPRKLIVFITHHHQDHVDGLSVVEKCNPDAILLAHENTMSFIKQGDWSLGYTPISGDEEICVGGERLRVVFAPGHTDGHAGLFHVSTRSLIVGDHCVGEGNAVLDAYCGGTMADYFRTTYKFMDLSPHVLIPQHGRVILWPKHKLSSYLKNRRKVESDVLRAIEDGANTLYDLVSTMYSEADRWIWMSAGSNVRLHVEHLAQQGKLPVVRVQGEQPFFDYPKGLIYHCARQLNDIVMGFSLEKFRRTCGVGFVGRCLWALSRSRLLSTL